MLHVPLDYVTARLFQFRTNLVTSRLHDVTHNIFIATAIELSGSTLRRCCASSESRRSFYCLPRGPPLKELSVGMPFAGRSDFLPALLVASSKANGVAWIPCIWLPAFFRGNKESEVERRCSDASLFVP